MFNDIAAGIYTFSATMNKQWGGVNPIDALMTNRNYIKLYNFKDNLYKQAADVNKDGKVNPIDALLINRRYIKLISSFNLDTGSLILIP